MTDRPLPLSVWPTAQQPARAQRADWYVRGSTAHPAKMLPAIARHAILAYSQPGDLVLDPLCGIGTTLVEVIRVGRDAVGVELEPRWAELACANLAHARALGAPGSGRVITGDARQLLELVGPELTGRVALVVTSPPYGSSLHGQVTARPGDGVIKYDNSYSEDRANLGRAREAALLPALGQILAGCHQLLRPGGLLVCTARPWRRRELLVDFPGALVRAGEQAGLVPFERNVALLVGLNGDRLVGRPSFFQLDRVRKARARGLPLRIIAHEDVLVLRPGALERARLTLGDWHHALGQLAETEQRMTGILDQLQVTSLVGSIQGLSAVGAAAILAESGDLARFAARALVKHAGLCLRDNQSGAYAGTTRISGRGRPGLRLAAWRAVWGALHANPVLGARHAHLTSRDHNQLTPTQARTALAAALLRWLWVVVTRPMPW